MSEKSGLSKLFDFLSKLAAIVVLLSLAFQTIIGLGWLKSVPTETLEKIAEIVNYSLKYGAVVLAGLVALEFGTQFGLLTTIIILVLIALVVVPQFFPEVWAQYNHYITVK